jgi:DNA repair ATPase RecN
MLTPFQYFIKNWKWIFAHSVMVGTAITVLIMVGEIKAASTQLSQSYWGDHEILSRTVIKVDNHIAVTQADHDKVVINTNRLDIIDEWHDKLISGQINHEDRLADLEKLLAEWKKDHETIIKISQKVDDLATSLDRIEKKLEKTSLSVNSTNPPVVQR